MVDEDIKHWFLYLSTKGIKDVTLWSFAGKPIKLPSHLFSCLELKHLKLSYYCFDPPASFHGFPNLLSLELHHVIFETGKFEEFLKMDYNSKMEKYPQVKLAEIAKLKILSLSLRFQLSRIMEHKASVFAPQDIISNMPDIVVTHILDRLPVQDAVKTGILSRNWRFKWTMLSRLVFDEMFFLYLFKTNHISEFGRIVSRLLLLKGAITKFVLCIEEQCYSVSVLDDEDIAHWILFLSRNGVKDLTILKMHGPRLKLPTHLFSCIMLKHLKLFYCCFDPPPSFHGFPNLLSLELGLVQFESGKLGEFLTRCPSLEILNMRYRRFFLEVLMSRYQQNSLEPMNMDIFSVGKVKLDEIAKVANLKMLSLSLCHLNNTVITNSNTIFELLGFLPKLQELDLDFVKCKFTEGGAKKRSPTAFLCLKALKLSTIDLDDGIMLSCAFELIRSFPNLQTLEIKASDWDDGPTPATCSIDLDYNTMGLLQLQSVVFTYLKGSENEVCLIKYLLGCSPFLKKIVIRHRSFLLSDEKLVFARKLLKLHRASPVVDIDLS
ncbi:hypothetical protein L1987_38914 [Smallanthus sonchifolius]|uniref:Uncharacterized protein n=1 Tax=Smallanthus sonchifolius TaxID=185202 RepID=A0ACB9HKU3_9ASTR|nr:hypothetical protein L1987_38914 [Smallanthus sonchifolius]